MENALQLRSRERSASDGRRREEGKDEEEKEGVSKMEG